jgi:hypothetical protein
MEKFIIENETEFLEPLKMNVDEGVREKHTQYKTRKFYYENYIRKVLGDNKKHFESLLNEYKAYAQEYKYNKQQEKEMGILNR